MSREELKSLIDNIPEKELDVLFRVLVRFVEEAEPLPDEIEVMNRPAGEVTPVEQFDWGL